MTTDLEDFIAFFGTKDIHAIPRRHPEDPDDDGTRMHWPLGCRGEIQWTAPCQILSVSQCHFIFDLDGRFVGTHADDMGDFTPRA